VYYGSSVLFQDNTLADDVAVATHIMSVDPNGAPTEALDPPISYSMQLQSNRSTNDTDLVAICVYWEYQANSGQGGWQTDGCITLPGPEGGPVTCQCTHMTNFAVLTRIKAPADTTNITKAGDLDATAHQLALDIITYIGVAISVPALLLMVFIFAVFKGLHNTGRFITGNLALSLAISLLIFVFGIDAVDNQTGCTAIAISLHYFLLVRQYFHTHNKQLDLHGVVADGIQCLDKTELALA